MGHGAAQRLNRLAGVPKLVPKLLSRGCVDSMSFGAQPLRDLASQYVPIVLREGGGVGSLENEKVNSRHFCNNYIDQIVHQRRFEAPLSTRITRQLQYTRILTPYGRHLL
jgi:hypothetical protein